MTFSVFADTIFIDSRFGGRQNIPQPYRITLRVLHWTCSSGWACWGLCHAHLRGCQAQVALRRLIFLRLRSTTWNFQERGSCGLPPFPPHPVLNSQERTALPRPTAGTTQKTVILGTYLPNKFWLVACKPIDGFSGQPDIKVWFLQVWADNIHKIKSRLPSWWGVNKCSCSSCKTVLKKRTLQMRENQS